MYACNLFVLRCGVVCRFWQICGVSGVHVEGGGLLADSYSRRRGVCVVCSWTERKGGLRLAMQGAHGQHPEGEF